MHVQTLLGDRLQTRAARRVADLAFQANTVRIERIARSLQVANLALLLKAFDSPSNDARRHQDETNEQHGDQRTPARGYRALCHARSLALRARGFSTISLSDAMRARRVSVVPNA